MDDDSSNDSSKARGNYSSDIEVTGSVSTPIAKGEISYQHSNAFSKISVKRGGTAIISLLDAGLVMIVTKSLLGKTRYSVMDSHTGFVVQIGEI